MVLSLSVSRIFKPIPIAIIHFFFFFSVTELNAISVSMQVCTVPEFVRGHFWSAFASQQWGGENITH